MRIFLLFDVLRNFGECMSITNFTGEGLARGWFLPGEAIESKLSTNILFRTTDCEEHQKSWLTLELRVSFFS